MLFRRVRKLVKGLTITAHLFFSSADGASPLRTSRSAGRARARARARSTLSFNKF